MLVLFILYGCGYLLLRIDHDFVHVGSAYDTKGVLYFYRHDVISTIGVPFNDRCVVKFYKPLMQLEKMVWNWFYKTQKVHKKVNYKYDGYNENKACITIFCFIIKYNFLF